MGKKNFLKKMQAIRVDINEVDPSEIFSLYSAQYLYIGAYFERSIGTFLLLRIKTDFDEIIEHCLSGNPNTETINNFREISKKTIFNCIKIEISEYFRKMYSNIINAIFDMINTMVIIWQYEMTYLFNINPMRVDTIRYESQYIGEDILKQLFYLMKKNVIKKLTLYYKNVVYNYQNLPISEIAEYLTHQGICFQRKKNDIIVTNLAD